MEKRTNKYADYCRSCGAHLAPGQGQLYRYYDNEDDEDKRGVNCLDETACAARVAQAAEEARAAAELRRQCQAAHNALLAEMLAAGWREVITELFGQSWREDDTAAPSGYLRIIEDEREIVACGARTSPYQVEATELARRRNPLRPDDAGWQGWKYFLR